MLTFLIFACCIFNFQLLHLNTAHFHSLLFPSSISHLICSCSFFIINNHVPPLSIAFAPWLRSNGGFQGDLFVHGAVSKLKSGYHYEGQQSLSASQAQSYISRGATLIANVNNGGHWVFCHTISGSSCLVNDPGYARDSYSMSAIVRFAIYWF